MSTIKLNGDPSREVTVVDVEIAGDVLRVVVDGTPQLRAKNPADALQELRAKHDDFRRFVIAPPRGHDGIVACVLLPPYSFEAVRTAVIAPQFGYAAIAGTPLMAAAAALIETGQVQVTDPETTLVFDTAAGKTHIVATIDEGRCTSFRWTTARPTVVLREQTLSLTDGRAVTAMVISPGLPYVVAPASELGVTFDNPNALGTTGAMLCDAATHQIGAPEGAAAYHAMLVGDLTIPQQPEAATAPVACVSANARVWSTPAGTGALSAAGYFTALETLALGREIITVSPTGFGFRCRIERTQSSVESGACIIALSQLVGRPSK